MRMMGIASLVLALWLLALPGAAAQQGEGERPLRLTYLFSDGNMGGTLAAYRELLEQHPELAGRVELQFLTESLFDGVDPQAIGASDVLVFDMMNQQMLDRYDDVHATDLLRHVASRGTVLAVGVGVQPLDHYLELGAVTDRDAMAWWQHGGQANQLSLLKHALQLGGVEGLTPAEPVPGLDFGYYYPDGNGGRVFADWDEFDAWRRDNGKTRDGAPRVAVGFYRATFYDNETEVVDSLIDEIERQGGEAIPFFGYPGFLAFERLLVDGDGEARADVALSLLMRFADFEATHALDRIDIPALNMITLYGRSEQEWRDSRTGLSLFEGTFQVAVPELAGLVAPTVIGSREREVDPLTGISVVVRRPIESRIEMAVQRAMRFERLARRSNEDKRIALMYYNYPAGKANVGASYLNIAESLSLILERMRDEGYDLGDADLSAEAILEDVTERARNVGSFAPGDLEDLVAAGSVARVDMRTYDEWFGELAPGLREKMLADWGPPEDAVLMAHGEGEDKAFIVPHLRYGNIILMPQPERAWGDDLEKLYHAKDLAPHHQYAAAYAWLRHAVDVDAVVHMGTHGTHEWLDGKDAGLTREDASEALIAELPNFYIYNVDVVGEGLVARRRGMATLIDHMVPSFVESDLYPELAAINESINDFDRAIHVNPLLADAYAGDIIEQVVRHGIDRALGLDLSGQTTLEHETIHEIMDYLVELRGQFIPYGMHAFGRLPTEEMRESTVNAIVAVDRSLLPDERNVFADDMEQRIILSARQELDSLMRALRGGYIKGGTGGEPIRNPDAYPTGKNFYGIDPDKVPKRAAWELGVRLADEMLEQHVAEHGEYPRKISFVIWGDETMRHEGILESQIFHLLGTRPVWDARDNVVDVEVVPSAELGRPRVDILIASAAEGMFHNVTVLMDRAVQRVKELEEAENYVRDHYLATRSRLIEMGFSEEDADRRAGVRIFDEPPGSFNLNTAGIAAASGTWDSDLGLANEYINKMGHGFGNGFWGEPMQETFRIALEGVEKVVHSSSTMLYGSLDNDDFFMYMGGLAASVRAVGGGEPDLVVTNTRDPGRPEMTSMTRFMEMEFRSRYVNPTWIEGMQQEGYAGARTMVEFVEYLWGWNATVPYIVDDLMWQEAFEVYVQDKHDLEMQAYFDEHSPYAFQDLTARMLETIRKEYWQPDGETLDEILAAYVDSVDRHGAGCSDVSCGNPRLMEFVVEQGLQADLPGVQLAAFRDAVERAVQGNIEELAEIQREFARGNDARIQEMFYGMAGALAELAGFRMERIERNSASPQFQTPFGGDLGGPAALVFQGLLLLMLLGWWHRRRRVRSWEERL